MGRSFANLEQRFVIRLSPTGEGGLLDMDKPDDLGLDNKIVAARYLSDSTVSANNAQQIEPHFNEVVLTDTNNNPAPLVLEDGSALNGSYLQQNMTEEAIAVYRQTSNSHFLDLEESPLKIKKGKSSSDGVTGAEIFKEINQLGGEASFPKRVQRVLEENNNYSDDKRFVSNNNAHNQENKVFSVGYVQQELGKHFPKKFPTKLESKPEDMLTMVHLKRLGLATMLHGTGELIVPSDPEIAALGTTFVPGVARMGQRVPVSKFSAINAYRTVQPNFSEKASSTNFIDGDSGKLSYGSYNNFAVMFSGRNSAPSVLSATLLLLTVGGLMKLVAQTFIVPSDSQEPINNQNPPTEYRKRRLGHYYPVDAPSPPSFGGFTSALFGLKVNLVKTRHPFDECVDRGVNLFFGLGDSDSSFANPAALVAGNVSAILGATPSSPVQQAHGYYNVVLRAIIRSASSFVLPGAEAVANLAGGEDDHNETATDVLTLADSANPFALINKLNSSMLLQFLNILAAIGDISLERERLGDFIDSIPDDLGGSTTAGGINPGILHAKSRLYDGSLAWKQSSIKSMFLMPPSLFGAASVFGTDKNMQLSSIVGAANNQPSQIDSSNRDLIVDDNSNLVNGNRIKQEIVKRMEEYLERDYMPFYFHDLRTNEIISFHAFLDSVSDGFSSDYSESEGFGRVGKIMVYKNTNRSISLAFKVIATSEDDFDNMWMKINKLTTMVYPQWTKGREVKFGQNRFVQPFSQHPSASPMIRLRLGDLFKSNYSKFALARLFGLSDSPSEFKLEGMETSPDGASTFTTQRSVIDRIARMTQRMTTGDLDNLQSGAQVPTFNPADHALLLPNVSTGTRYSKVGSPAGSALGSAARQAHHAARAARGATSRTAQQDPNNLTLSYRASVVVESRIDSNNYVISIINPADGQSGSWQVPTSALSKDDAWIVREAYRQVVGESSTNDNSGANNTRDVIGAFTSPDNNPVFKAFDSTSGKGLAGFIKDLKIEFGEATWATDQFNSRAPKMITVSIDFAPIHDLQPGIDHNGFNTAPIYNIGRTMAAIAYDRQQDVVEGEQRFNSSRRPLSNWNPR